jgi:hypothetical protein
MSFWTTSSDFPYLAYEPRRFRGFVYLEEIAKVRSRYQGENREETAIAIKKLDLVELFLTQILPFMVIAQENRHEKVFIN